MGEEMLFVAYPRSPGYRPKGEEPGRLRAKAPTRRMMLTVFKDEFSAVLYKYNRAWSHALNKKRAGDNIVLWGMNHQDVIPHPFWADVQRDEMDRFGADVMSAVIPIKDGRGLTTTGLRNWKNGAIRRLTMTEIFQLPETFGLADVQSLGIKSHPESDPACDVLAINTGLWLCRFTDSWCEEFGRGGYDPRYGRAGFWQQDDMRQRPDGDFEAVFLSEDWLFSEWAGRRGLNVMATRKVPLGHWTGEPGEPGSVEYRNDSVWGTCQTDPGDVQAA